MDRSGQQPLLPSSAAPQNAPTAAPGYQQQQQAPPPPQAQASGAQQPPQPAESQQQRAPALGGASRTPPPPPPRKPAGDPMPLSMSPTTEGHYEDPSGSRDGSSPSRDQPVRRGSAPLAPPTRALSRDGGNANWGNGTYRSVEVPPGGQPHHPRRLGSTAREWILPEREVVSTYVPRSRTVGERLQPTLDQACIERNKYQRKAWLNGYALNMAIGLQVILGALVTGLSAAISAKHVGITTSVLGGATTLVASYLARMRGSNEPELSITRTKDLDQFIRECDAFQMDKGHITDSSEDPRLTDLRRRFEELLGNANGERKLSPT